MNLSAYFPSSYFNAASSNSGSSSSSSNNSADILAKVSKVMEAQNTGAPKLNAALASDNTKLSGLGKLLSSLTTFQSAAQSLSTTGAAAQGVAQDPAGLAKNVSNLVDKYNALNASLNGLKQGELKADASVSRIQNQLAQVFGAGASGTAGLASIGVSTRKDGSLAIDATKLQNAINANPDGVAKLFGNGGKGIADKLVSQIQGMVGSTGSISKETTAINKDIAALNVKKDNLSKALTLQANALVAQYTQQSQSGSATSSGGGSGGYSLFDYI